MRTRHKFISLLIINSETMHLFIIGYMGSGKTTLGKRIAHAFGMPFIDLDYYFEASFRTSIPLFFERYGEPAFREIERQLLIEVSTRVDHSIVSTGGGTPCHFENLQLMKQRGRVVYLKLSAAMLASRLYHSPLRYKRPILKGLDKEQMLRKIQDQLLEREKFYNQADLIIETKHLNTTELLEIIIENFPELNRK